MPIEKLRPTFTFTEERLKELQAVVPEAFADGKINWDTVRDALGEHLEDESQEHFGLSWPGKREARRLASMPSKGTLAPQPGQGVNEESTHNLFIEGDNLEVLKLLQKSYAGRVKMIYIDPPYNTGNDFVYPDDYSEPLEVYLRRIGQVNEAGQLMTSNSMASGRFHSNWLNMIYPRLLLARQVLSLDGLIFISIDEHEISKLRLLMDEIFGEENFLECFVWKKSYGGGAKEKYAVRQHEYILLYAKSLENVSELWLPPDEESEKRYYKYTDARGAYRIKPLEATKSMDSRPNLVYAIPTPWGEEVMPKRQWWWSRERVIKALERDELVFTRNGEEISVSYKQYLFDEEGNKRGAKPFSIIDGFYTQHGTQDLRSIFDGELVMQFPKPVDLIKHLLYVGTGIDQEDIVLDFFAGSATTAQAVMKQNREDGGKRRFILVQLPEPTEGKYKSIAEIGKERIRRVIARIKAENQGKIDFNPNNDLGFRCFQLEKSHFVQWRPYAEEDTGQLELRFQQAETPLVPGWQPGDLLTEILLLQGFPLDSRVRELAEFGHNRMQEVSSEFCQHRLYVCLDKSIQAETVPAIQLRPEDVLVCLDSALSDEAKIVLADRCNLKVI